MKIMLQTELDNLRTGISTKLTKEIDQDEKTEKFFFGGGKSGFRTGSCANKWPFRTCATRMGEIG
jgi:hypothetical protein